MSRPSSFDNGGICVEVAPIVVPPCHVIGRIDSAIVAEVADERPAAVACQARVFELNPVDWRPGIF